VNNVTPELLERARTVRLVLLDVDGVLTDGHLWYGPQGEMMKVFDVKDGHGIVIARNHVDFGVISGRPQELAERRLRELRVKHLYFANLDKLSCYEELIARLTLTDEQVAFMGDDVNDLPLLERVGLSACPADAVAAVRQRTRFVSSCPGGRGAVRELCDLVVRAKTG
jgi:3-deoxy-D-manno-octulosonate 8-phosphate phosphatase (KDO 8-P phosphatase)